MMKPYSPWLAFLLLVLLAVSIARAQPAAAPAESREPPAENQPQPQLPEIRDEPRTVDPARLMPSPLVVSVTVDLSNSSLGEVVNWLRDELGLVVLLKRLALSADGVLPSEPVSDRLDDQPVFQLLDRLRLIEVGWYFENDILHITSADDANSRLATFPYTIGDLLDAGFEAEQLSETIEDTISPDQWVNAGGDGSLNILGDVMFVRQSDAVQREVHGFLSALREHGRRTFILDSPRHEDIRRKLDENVAVDFRDTPLEAVVRELGEMTGIDARLDIRALREARVREREPVTIRLSERKLRTVLQAISMDLDLAWILRDGALWITSSVEAEEFAKTAVFDVRDLCRDAAESEALLDAITEQAVAGSWAEAGGNGRIHFAKPGTMVARHEEHVLDSVLELLEAYRSALRGSKPRDRGVDPGEVVTFYYRMHAEIADDLANLLPAMVRPDSWKSGDRPDAPGEVIRATSTPELLTASGGPRSVSTTGNGHAVVSSRAVLIITQTRAAHDEIIEVVRRVQSGDSHVSDALLTGGIGMGGMGGMGGGFGGGYFAVPD